MNLSLRLLPFLASALLLPGPACAEPDAPLPEPDSHYGPGDSFPLLPPVDGLPPPESPPGEPPAEDSVVVPPPAPMPDLPEFDPLTLPSDGEAMPELPPAPGLIPPQFKTSREAIPGLSILPNAAPDGLLPAPALAFKPDTSRGYWFPSPLEARRVSIKEKKPLLLFFAQRFDARDEQGNTGCPTIALNDDLFVPEDFNKFAGEKLVLTSLQYPPMSLKSSRMPEAKKKALQHFQDHFKVTGFPAVILIDETGREIVRIKGYTRVRDNNNQLWSDAPTMLERLKEATHRAEQRRAYRQEQVDRLIAQGYRTWTDRKGYTLLAKLVEATPQRIVFMDENKRLRAVLPEQICLYDAEWARRKQAGLIRDEKETPRSTAAATP